MQWTRTGRIKTENAQKLRTTHSGLKAPEDTRNYSLMQIDTVRATGAMLNPAVASGTAAIYTAARKTIQGAGCYETGCRPAVGASDQEWGMSAI